MFSVILYHYVEHSEYPLNYTPLLTNFPYEFWVDYFIPCILTNVVASTAELGRILPISLVSATTSQEMYVSETLRELMESVLEELEEDRIVTRGLSRSSSSRFLQVKVKNIMSIVVLLSVSRKELHTNSVLSVLFV